MIKNLNALIATQVSLTVWTVGEAFGAQNVHPVTGQHLEGELEEAFGVHAAHPVEDAVHDAAAAHGGGGGLPQLDPTWYPSQIFWLIITFSILYLLFSKHILPALSGTLEARRTQIDGDLETAREMKKKAEDVHQAYEEALQEARAKANEALHKAEAKAKQKAAESLQALRETSAKHIEDADGRLAKEKKKALVDMDSIAAEVASEAAAKIFGITADVKQVKNVIDNMNKKAA